MTDESVRDVYIPVDPASSPPMATEYPVDPTLVMPIDPAPRRRRRRPPIWWITIVALGLFVLVGLGSLGYYAYLTLRPPSNTAGSSPWDSLVPAQILPGPAVALLAGVNQEKIYRETMAVDAIETATAQAIANADLSEVQRLGWLAVLARRYALQGDQDRASELYQLAADLALLAPELGDHQRADTLLSVASGWHLLGQKEKASDVLAQVKLIARQSPQLEPPVRRQLLESAARLHDRLGDLESARRTRALPAESPSQPVTPPLDPLHQIKSLGPPDYPQTIINAEAVRRAQAQAFADGWIGREGEVAKGQTQALERALLDEDLVRSAFYDQKLADVTLPPLERARVQWDQILWLIIKHRAASDLYGLALVPGWTADQIAIRQSVQDAFGRMSDLISQHLQTLGPEQQGQASYNYYRHALLAARIGLYPDAGQVFLANAMNDALLRWQQATGLAPIAVIEKDGSVNFKLLDVSGNQTSAETQ